MDRTATYIYCVLKAGRRPSLTRVPTGLPGASAPESIEAAPGLWVVAADVPLNSYGPEVVEASLSNLDWVTEVALAHDAVVEHCSRITSAATIPMKMLTMFSSRERAVADVRARRKTLDAVAGRVAGREEWGVRVNLDQPAGRPAAAVTQSASGAAFLAAKKRVRDDRRAALLEAAEAAEDAYEALSTIASGATRRDDAPEGATPPLLDAAFLVSRTRRAEFRKVVRRAAEECGRAGAALTLSGPWPAYNFVTERRPRR